MEWTDTEMKERLESLGYNLTDDYGKYSRDLMVEIASLTEGYKWNDKKERWYE